MEIKQYNSIITKRLLKKSKWKLKKKKNLEINYNKNTMTQNLQDAAKSVLRGKLIVMQSYLKK